MMKEILFYSTRIRTPVTQVLAFSKEFIHAVESNLPVLSSAVALNLRAKQVFQSGFFFVFSALQWSKSFAICEQLQSVYRSADFFQLLRVSDFGFLSLFGLRPSGFRLRRAALSAVK